MTIIKDNITGGSYQSYASGNGCLSFVHIDCRGRATNETVPLETARLLTPDGWQLSHHTGRYEAYRPVSRIGDDCLLMDSCVYTYSVEFSNTEWTGFEFYKHQEVLKNQSVRASLRYFLENEDILPNET